MMIVGLTGGIGSGKSTVAKLFKQMGVPVYDSDSEAKELMVTSETLREQIKTLLGDNAYLGKRLNKTFISNQIFNDSDILQKLNEIVHPAVKTHFSDWTLLQKKPYVIQETALIFENETQHYYDAIILVTAPEAQRIQRVMDRDCISRAKVLKRISNQLDDIDKVEKADYVIENILLDDTVLQVNKIHQTLLNKATKA